MNALFELDPYPGKLKILFVGLANSTHTHAWIDLLSEAKFNVRLFSIPDGGVPPADWKIRTYVCASSYQITESLDPATRKSFYFPVEKITKLRKNFFFLIYAAIKFVMNYFGNFIEMPNLIFDYSNYSLRRSILMKKSSPDEWLARVIQTWQPDIIHTLGLFDGQGGLFYFNVRKHFALEKIGTWVVQVRGGPDTVLRRYDLNTAQQIKDMFSECDQIIVDNYANLEYVNKLGYGDKIASISPVPGTGGIRIDTSIDNLTPPSLRQRIIYWPKAYEGVQSKALPVLEAIKLAWETIKPCTIYITAINSEIEGWLTALPDEIRANCIINYRIPRQQVFDIMQQARIMLAPSIMDGVPNVLYEAMAFGAFPIVSPLDSITPIVKDETNVLFVRNLYPDEIASAIVRSMNDNALVDAAAITNLTLVGQIADRSTIKEKVKSYYSSLLEEQ